MFNLTLYTIERILSSTYFIFEDQNFNKMETS